MNGAAWVRQFENIWPARRKMNLGQGHIEDLICDPVMIPKPEQTTAEFRVPADSAEKLMDGLLDKVRGTFQAPLDLSVGIPAVLSVKVTRDGGLTVYVQPSKPGEPDRNTMIYRAIQDQLWQFARVPEDQQIYRPDAD